MFVRHARFLVFPTPAGVPGAGFHDVLHLQHWREEERERPERVIPHRGDDEELRHGGGEERQDQRGDRRRWGLRRGVRRSDEDDGAVQTHLQRARELLGAARGQAGAALSARSELPVELVGGWMGG